MFALSILYFILFIFVRIQSQKFGSTNSSGDHRPLSQELSNWQASLETDTEAPPTKSQEIITTKTVTITTEDRSASIRRTRKSDADLSRRRMAQVAVRLLCYPAVYICLTMPVSMARLALFAGHNWGVTAIQVGASIYVCSGFVNVILYTATRKGIISWNWLVPKRTADFERRRLSLILSRRHLSSSPSPHPRTHEQISSSATLPSNHSALVPNPNHQSATC